MANSLAHAQGGNGAAERARDLPVFVPMTDIWETGDRLVLYAEIPGADADGIDISVDRNILRLTARGRMTGPEGYSLIHGEFRPGDYERAFTLPAEIEVDKIEASVKDGLLTLVLPKAAPPPARKITVKAH